eukprot:1122988-Pleurochrysis_carterae.AAC.1
MARKGRCPPWSEKRACIIPAVTAAVRKTTFVMRDTIGQMPLTSRPPGAGDDCESSFSPPVSSFNETLGAAASRGFGGAMFEDDSFGAWASESDSDVPDGSSLSGCDGGGSGKSSSAKCS